MTRLACMLFLAAVALGLASCEDKNTMKPGGPDITVAVDPRRDSDAARQANHKGLDLLAKGKLDDAAKRFEEAILADPFYGPAHNNLGAVYDRQKRFYQAAMAYQQASKLMPTRPEPLSNLGMIREKTMRLDEAMKAYEDALKLAPDHPEIVGNLARVRIRLGKLDPKTRELLQQVVDRDVRDDWQHWARQTLVTWPRAQTQPTTMPTTIDIPARK